MKIFKISSSVAGTVTKTNDDNNSHSPFLFEVLLHDFFVCVSLLLELQSRNNTFIVILQIIFTNSLFFYCMCEKCIEETKKKWNGRHSAPIFVGGLIL